MVTYYSKILHASWRGSAVAGGVPWLWPLLGILHVIGMALLVGCIGAIDLRTLGLARGLPLRPLNDLLPWALAGFAINLMSGLAIYAGNPEGYQSGAFFFKMVCLLLAGLNGLLFYSSGFNRELSAVGPGEDAPLAAKLTAVASLVLWVAVIFWGRMLTFFSSF